jgi:hypothetical protein
MKNGSVGAVDFRGWGVHLKSGEKLVCEPKNRSSLGLHQRIRSKAK